MWRCRMLEAGELMNLPIASMMDTVLSPHGATQVVRFLIQANKAMENLRTQQPHVDVLATPPNLAGTDYVYLTTDVEGVRLDKIGEGAEVGPIDGVRTTCFTVSVANEEWKLELMSTPSAKVGLCHMYSGCPVETINNSDYEDAIRESQAAIDHMLSVQRSLELARSEREELERLREEVRGMQGLRRELEAAKNEVRGLKERESKMKVTSMRRTPPQRRHAQRSISPDRMLLSPLPLERHISRSPTHQPTSTSPQRRDISPPPSPNSSPAPAPNAISHPRLGIIMAPTYEPTFQPSA